jgi:hypothetical protein
VPSHTRVAEIASNRECRLPPTSVSSLNTAVGIGPLISDRYFVIDATGAVLSDGPETADELRGSGEWPARTISVDLVAQVIRVG